MISGAQGHRGTGAQGHRGGGSGGRLIFPEGKGGGGFASRWEVLNMMVR